METAMRTAEDIILDKNNEIVAISRDTSLAEAIALMNRHRIGAILIQDGDQMVGIWTERDYLRASSQPDFDPGSAKAGDHMSSPLHIAPHDASITQLEEMFLGLYLRHIPIDKNGRCIGMVSIGDVLRASLLEKDRRIKELNSIASWQYYENWGWDREKG